MLCWSGPPLVESQIHPGRGNYQGRGLVLRADLSHASDAIGLEQLIANAGIAPDL